jgi:hypothetical protein
VAFGGFGTSEIDPTRRTDEDDAPTRPLTFQQKP